MLFTDYIPCDECRDIFKNGSKRKKRHLVNTKRNLRRCNNCVYILQRN